MAAPLELELRWTGGLRFDGTSDGRSLELDSDGREGVSPMQALAFGLAGCMAVDVVSILRKARHEPRGLRVRLSGRRAESPPRRFVAIALEFLVEGAVPPDRVEHAIELSRKTYCSVWHSLRPDIGFETSFEVRP